MIFRQCLCHPFTSKCWKLQGTEADTGGKFAAGIVDTSGKFFAGIIDTSCKFATGINNTSETVGKFATSDVDTGGAP